MSLAIAIFPWGDVIEDFLAPLDLTAQRFAHEMTGGWLFNTIQSLQLLGHRPFIVYGCRSCSQPERMIHFQTGIPIWLIPARSASRFGFGNLASVSRWLLTPARAFEATLLGERVDVILAQEYEYARFDRLIAIGRKLQVPVYATFQGGDWTSSRFEEMVRPRSFKHCHGLIVASRQERERLRAQYGEALPPVYDIPNPLDVKEWRREDRAKARAELGISKSQFVAINHGRIDIVRKGLDVLISAWEKVRDARLVIIGSGQDNDKFRQMLEDSPAAKSIDWHDRYVTDRSFMRRWLSAADVHVTSSRVEGMPVAPLEAMSCELPVITSDAQGLQDILPDGEASGGLVVAREQPLLLAAAIARLQSSPDLRRTIASAARKRAESSFSIEAAAAKLEDLLRHNRLKA